MKKYNVLIFMFLCIFMLSASSFAAIRVFGIGEIGETFFEILSIALLNSSRLFFVCDSSSVALKIFFAVSVLL